MSKSGVTDNNKEILDIVDENDNVIGQMSKKEIHAGQGILHREVAVLIRDKNGNLLLQQRSYKKKYFPGKWSITASGHVLSGQTPEEAAHMELREELGFDTKLTFVEKRKYSWQNNTALGSLFVGEFPSGVMITPDKDELEKAGFFSVSEIYKMMENESLDPHSTRNIKEFLSGKYS